MTDTSTAVQELPAQTQLQTMNNSSAALMMNSEAMDRMMRMAEIMAKGVSTVPRHLQGNVGDCFAVTIQAHVWGMLPHIVAQKTHLVNGTLGYEAQLINAVVCSSGAIEGRFHYEYEGKSPNLSCRVGAVIRGETEIVWSMWLNEKDVVTKNSPLWKVNPPQQLGYLQVKNWTRMYTPAAILGVYSEDELSTFKAPVNMGNAEVVDTRPQVDADALIKLAWEKAEGGMSVFAPWYSAHPKSTDGREREIIAPHRQAMIDRANEVDSKRTVDQPKQGEPQQETGTGEITVEQVLAKINSAKNEDALYVAADWINEIIDNAAAASLNERFNARLSEMRSGA